MDYRNSTALVVLTLASVTFACDKVDCPAGTKDIEGHCTAPEESDENATIGGGSGPDDSDDEANESGGMNNGDSGGSGDRGNTGSSRNTGTAASGAAAANGGSGGSGGSSDGAAASGAASSGAASNRGNADKMNSGSCSSETCDNEDNDCDGKTDEDVTRPCGPETAIGSCKPGTEECSAGEWSGTCTDAVEAGDEVCDAEGLDENCDGTSNEGCACTPGKMQPCGMMGGICMQGMQVCDDSGQWSDACVGGVTPETEVCDGAKDENCDGDIDEGCDCTNGETMDCGSDVGECALGEKTCMKGKWGTTCQGERKPGTESCDSRDNDCDGKTDEGVLNACGGCSRLANPPETECSAGEFSCEESGEYECDGRDATTCNARASSGSDERCDFLDNDCDGRTDEDLVNDCGGPCTTRLPGEEGDSCTVSRSGSCTVPGEYQCAGRSLRCVAKCWYLCVRGTESSATRTQDPCGWAGNSPDSVCVPENPGCL